MNKISTFIGIFVERCTELNHSATVTRRKDALFITVFGNDLEYDMVVTIKHIEKARSVRDFALNFANSVREEAA